MVLEPPDIECITEPIATYPPPPVQEELFGGVPAVLEMLPTLEDRFVTTAPKVRRIEERLGVDTRTARRLYQEAKAVFDHRMAYERYLRCKKYVDWRRSREGQIEIRDHMAERDRRYEESMPDDLGHVVEITGVDSELARLLDAEGWALTSYRGPLQFLVEDLKRLTRRDAEILLKRGYLRVIEGDLDTVLTAYNYPAEIEQWHPEPPLRCVECGRALTYNIVGVNQKLGAKEARYYRCLDCLGVSEEQAKSLIERYKSDGCPLFV